MKGSILDFSLQTSEGVISGEDGKRYKFSGADWKGKQYPNSGMKVDFDAQEGKAFDIYLDTLQKQPATASSSYSENTGKKSRTTAAIWAFFLGGFGAHKFYLGLTKPATIMLLVSLIGSIFVLPILIMGLIGFIEFIIYLTISDDEFERKYLIERKEWF